MSKQVEYILFTGTQCIDTGFKPNGNTTVEIEFSLNSNVTDNRAVLGARTSASGSDSTSFTIWTIDSTKIRFDHYGTSNTITNYNPKEKHICKMTPTEEIIDGVILKKHFRLSNTSPVNLTLGKANTNNVDNYYGKCKIYSCKIYNGETLVRNFVPYKDDNKKFCMKDLVYNTLYYSATTSDLNGPFDPKETGSILNFDYTGTVQTVTLPKGTYKLECWGAQGGNGCTGNSYKGGTGGYSQGALTLAKTETLYIYVGGQGVSAAASGVGNIREGGFNGGGSGRDWSSTNHGGGGGGGASDIRIVTDSFYARVIVAGAGGGASDNGAGGAGGGTSGISSSSSAGTATGGSGFGQAAASSYTSGECGGGGGGWYGGYGGSSENYSGGGGSGYVYTSSSASNYPSGCLLNSSYYLANAKTIAGNTSFSSPTGSSETGHSGNGYCRITVIECKSTALYTRINNSMKKATAFYFKLNNNKMYGVGSASPNSQNSNIMNFSYTGSVQTATLAPGTYTIECWGGQGGSYSSYIGGYGGYSKGTITLTKTTTVYVSVGGAGSSSSTAAGFNGGGTGVSSGRGGGGATDVRISQNSLYSRVIVAGGGGGAGVTSANANPCGCGGGEYGGDGYYNDTTGSYTIGTGRCGGSASQTAGGKAWSTGTQATFGQGGNASGYSCGGGGGGWYGGGGAYDNDSDSDGRWGGGGSGYVYTSSTAKNYPNGCLLNSTHYLTNAQTIAGNTSFTSPTESAETGHTGNGFCRITNLTPTQYGLYVKTNSGWKHIDL